MADFVYTVSSAKRDQVRAHLLDLIDAGTPGTSIPSERQLCAQLSVSRPTLRSVVDAFVRDGVLVRHHGKGVFIARRKIAQDLAQAGGHLLPGAVDGTWTSRVLTFDVVAAGARVARRLHAAPPDPVVRVHRLRLVDGEPMCLETVHLPRRFVPGLRRDDLAGASLYALLRRRFDIAVARATQVIEPSVTDADEAALLDVPAQSPALVFERTTRDTEGRVVEFTHAIYRGDRYRIVSQLELGADTRPAEPGLLVGSWSPQPS
ncbi:MAG TPA: GntR family transcriptional regulator [Pseudonocardiaceae bacterium]|jgi:GntR family transcriptional regulator|nr:GntR family transcriptional regulator [Pseudonocardiaceae bacterium]